MRQAGIALLTFACAAAADVATKLHAVAHPRVVYNGRPSNLVVRLWVSLLTIAVVFLVEQLGRRRGLGRLWGAWIAVGVLTAGTLSNGISSYVWSQGVPDFIRMSDGWVWNVADFEIVFGLLGTAASIVVAAMLAYARGRR